MFVGGLPLDLMNSLIARHITRREMLRAWAAQDIDVFNGFCRTVTQLLATPIADLRILDLGCGSNAPMTVLLHAAGCRVTGADAELGLRWGLGFSPARLTAYGRQAGLLKAARKALGELVYDRFYFKHLAALSTLPLADEGLDIRRMEVGALELPSESFDAVHSNATWEHVRDVASANREVARVLKPGGVAYIEIHLFPSLSGGHDLPWTVPGKTVMGDVTPWRHLRNPSWQPPVFLNRLREADYRAMFESTDDLEIVDWRTEFTEGQELLTREIQSSLEAYTAEELTKRSIIVVARKRQRGGEGEAIK
jgi:SAM-dependent methyltransferase